MSNDKGVRILYVGNSEADQERIRSALSRGGFPFTLEVADSFPRFTKFLSKGPWQLLLADFELRGKPPFAVLDHARAMAPPAPVVIVTANGSEEVAAEAVNRGAAGYVRSTDGDIDQLPLVVQLMLDRQRELQASDETSQTQQRLVEQSLQVSQSILKSFFSGAPFQMGISELTADKDLLLILVNPAAAASIGRTPEQVAGMRISELGLPGPSKGVWLDQYLNAIRTRRPVHFERAIPLPSGEQWWDITLAFIGEGPTGAPRFSYIVQDITARKRDEHAQAAQLEISLAAQGESTLQEMFRRVHEVIGGLLPADNFGVALFDRDSDEISYPYWVDEYSAAPRPRKLDELSLMARVVRSGQSLLLTPETADYDSVDESGDFGMPSLDWLGVPLQSKTRVIGALVVQSYSGDVHYDEKDKALLEFASSQVAATIERKQAEEAIVASESRFRLLFEQSLAGVFRSRPDGSLLQCNDAFARMLGFGSQEDLIDVNARSLYFEPGEREELLATLREQGAVNNTVTRLRRRDGYEVWCMETINLIHDEHGEPEVLQGTLIDFTDYKQAQEALSLSESRLEEAQRVAHLGSWNWDPTTGVLSWSDELCRIYGLDPASHVPSFGDFLGRIHEDDRRRVAGLMTKAIVDRQPFSNESRIIRPDGEVRTVFDQGEVLIDETGSAVGMAGACQDITLRKMEELLEHDRGLILEQVAQNLPLTNIIAKLSNSLEHQRPGLKACVLLVKNGRLKFGGGASMTEGFVEAIEGLSIGPDAGCFGAAANSAAPVLVADTSGHPSWATLAAVAEKERIKSCWSHPILSAAGGVLGTISLCGEVQRVAADADVRLLESACRLAAIAIEHRELTEQLSHQAQHDALTGLPNRLLFHDRLSQALAQAERHEHQVAVLYMDMDRFKQINDTMGHSSGDALLRQTAGRLDACIRKSDTLARLGGDEFTVVLTELTDPGDAMRLAKQLIETMRVPFMVDGRELFVSVSLGISIYPDDGIDGEALMANADVAMYRAKEKGRDNFQWFAPEMNTLARERMELETQLRHALALGQLSLCYQPQCGANGEIKNLEALMRWRHPTLGAVSPSRFMPLAEESGLIVHMGEWALREACAQTVIWRAVNPNLRVSVNVSAVQFKREDWVDTVRRALHDTGMAPEALELEITESLLLHSVKETSANLFELRELGVGVAIDDFGTGYSSLSYLHKLPITTLKIDQSFVREIGRQAVEGQEEAPIIRTIIALAHNLGMSVVAEGVETEAQRELLLRLGCESLQGYLLHRPLTVSQTTALLEASASSTSPA